MQSRTAHCYECLMSCNGSTPGQISQYMQTKLPLVEREKDQRKERGKKKSILGRKWCVVVMLWNTTGLNDTTNFRRQKDRVLGFKRRLKKLEVLALSVQIHRPQNCEGCMQHLNRQRQVDTPQRNTVLESVICNTFQVSNSPTAVKQPVGW